MTHWFFLLCLFLIPIQTTWLQGLSVASIRPDLGFLLVYFVGFYAGERKGLIAGLLTGALWDLFSGGPPGLNLITKGLIGLLSGILGRWFLNVTGPVTMCLILLLSMVSGITTYGIHQFAMGPIELAQVFRWTILPEALYNAVMGGLFFWIGLRRLQSETATPL